MIAYSVFAVVFSAWIVLVTVFGEKKSGKAFARSADKWMTFCGLAAVAIGTIGCIVTFFRCEDKEMSEWIRETLLTYSYVYIPVFLLLFAVSIIASLSASRNPVLQRRIVHRLRIVMIASSSLFLISLNYLAFIAENSNINLTVYLLAAGAGLACVMRFPAGIERKIYGDKNEKK